MDTKEHTQLGNSLKLADLHNNPYLRIGSDGELRIRMMRFNFDGIPTEMPLELSAGEIVAMAGDYFTDATWVMDLDLPKRQQFKTYQELGRFLIERPIKPQEHEALLRAYNNLAAPDVSRGQIDTIYSIDSANYLPFSEELNDYIRQIMLYLRVKDYGEMLIRNQTHFTPWSVRVYILGHNLALYFASLAHELHQLAEHPDYEVDEDCAESLMQILYASKEKMSKEVLHDLAYRYHALSLTMELFTFHYYSDHFAAGHMSMVGDLRVLLQERFGQTIGGILANNLHNELNRVGVYAKRAYDPTPDSSEPPIDSRGDGSFGRCANRFNKVACLAGMQYSLADIDKVLAGGSCPSQQNFGGLEHLLDVDDNYRQILPLLVYAENGKIYRRGHLGHIPYISPSDYDDLKDNPEKHGYKELSSYFHALILIMKLRLFPFAYEGQLQALSAEDKARIEQDEQRRIPNRKPIPAVDCETSGFEWRLDRSGDSVKSGLQQNSFFKPDPLVFESDDEPQSELTLS